MDPGNGSGSNPNPRKTLQEMSKEELVQKCKGLLTLAQKAKVAKDGEFRIELSNRKPVNRLKLPQLTEFTKPDFSRSFF